MTTSQLWVLTALLVQAAGVLHAAHAVFRARSPQAAIAWSVSLVTMPWLAIPFYWVFGRNRFRGYVISRRAGADITVESWQMITAAMGSHRAEQDGAAGALCRSTERLTGLPCTTGNAVELFADGGGAFSAMLEDIAAAEGYVFIQSFIVEEGRLAEELAAVLRQKVLEGVAVHFLFDELGSRKLSRRYRQHLQSSGIRVASYRSVMGRGYRLQLNFRNHRKLTVIDGRVAYTGGLNLADEYLGRHPRLGPWRDTHVRIRGPAVLGLQLSFAEDWHWATGEQLHLDCGKEEPAPGCQAVAVVPTGPADDVDVCQLFMLEAINSATERLWIASPYFVPGPAIAAALQSAAIRGVDVRILLPQNPDHILVYLAAFSYYEEMDRAGVSIHRYQPGFMHQKVVLIDGTMATVGTVNLDNRSFHLNFELTVLVADGGFAGQVKEMLERDFALSKRASVQDFTKRSVPFRLAVQLCRLLAPIL